VSDDASLERPQLVWDMVAGVFCIHVPRRRPAGNSIIEAGLDDDLDGFFVGAPQNAMATQNEKEPESALPAEDNWTDIGGVDDQRTEPARGGAPPIPVPSRPVPRRTQAASKVDDLPAVGAVSRPARLFKSIAPYVLTVNATKIPLLVQGSHQPSLEYIAGYLKKWARIDQNNAAKVRASHSDALLGLLLIYSPKLPLLKVTMVESAFFSDVIDTITVEPNYFRGDPEPLNPTLILGFVEGVLGYEETYTNGTRWAFKLDPESHSGTGLLERNRGVL
jgi:hypothetical protein